jgi:hypothetical protein
MCFSLCLGENSCQLMEDEEEREEEEMMETEEGEKNGEKK